MNRPSPKEIQGKLRKARAAVKNGSVFLIDQEALADDAIELGYDIGAELLDVLAELFEEISMDDYAGSRPPQKSYKDDIQGLYLFPFVLECQRFECRIYLKFAITEDVLWLISLHKDRPEKEIP